MRVRWTAEARLQRGFGKSVNHDDIGTEHPLVGFLLEGEGVAAQVLTSLGLPLEHVRRGVEIA